MTISPRPRSARTALAAAAISAAALAAGVPAADAWNVSASADLPKLITFQGAPGEVNAPTLERVGAGQDVLRFRDAGGTPSWDESCAGLQDPPLAECVAIGDTNVRFRLGDLNDTLTVGNAVTNVPVLHVSGEAGNDRLSNQGRDGTLSGGSGSDLLQPGPGVDTVMGGTGLDAVDYSDRTEPVVIDLRTLNGQPNPVSGEAGEGDTLMQDLEGAYGGKGADQITTAGADDQVVPGAGQDTVQTLTGDDLVDARDGAKDTIDCGAGTDEVYADSGDVTANCETVRRPSNGLPLAAPSPLELPKPLGSPPAGPGPLPAPPAPLPPGCGTETPGGGTETPGGGTGTGTGTGGQTGGTAGGGTTGGGTTADRIRPALTSVSLSRALIRRAALPTVSRLRFTLSEPAAVKVTVGKLVAGRRAGGRCVRSTAKLRRGGAKVCLRTVPVASVRRAAPKGASSIRVTARVGKTLLKPGAYRLTVVATDAAGNRSAAVSRSLRVAAR